VEIKGVVIEDPVRLISVSLFYTYKEEYTFSNNRLIPKEEVSLVKIPLLSPCPNGSPDA
jgi:hypothetical protein